MLFNLTVVRREGLHPLTGELIPGASETLQIEASDLHGAYQLTAVYQTLPFCGQEREVYTVDGAQLFHDQWTA